MNKILTVIIPTYNMERYLNNCLDSLVVPNMDKAEVLIINDGSKDSSSLIAHEYQDKYPNTFRVIDKENGNYGSCINRGLKEASGKYIKVLDADDSFDKASFNNYLCRLEKIESDLVLTDFQIVDENGNATHNFTYSSNYHNIPLNRPFDFKEFINNPSYTFYGQMHGFTYRTIILRQMEYHQTEGISYTDQEWVFIPVTKVNTCYYCQLSLYRYLVGRSGQTINNMGKSVKQIITVINSMAAYYYSHTKESSAYKKYLLGQLKFQIGQIYQFALYGKMFPLEILRDFDSNLKAYPELYHSVDSNIYDGFPLYFKYILYWRNHQDKPLPGIFLKVKTFKLRLKSFVNRLK